MFLLVFMPSISVLLIIFHTKESLQGLLELKLASLQVCPAADINLILNVPPRKKSFQSFQCSLVSNY